jgi:hypothetical protein
VESHSRRVCFTPMNGHRLTGPTGPFRANFGLAPLHLLAMLITSMKLVFLHGSPAVGKLTVAKALLRMVSGRLFDNHAAIDWRARSSK